MLMTKAWLSVIMPVHNGAAFLDTALASVAGQNDLEGVEVIVVDDGSDDATPSILHCYKDRLPMRVLSHRAGSWVAGTNLGLRQSDASFACILHQDDVWLPGRLDTIRAELRCADSQTMVLHNALFIDSCGRHHGHWRCPLPAGPVPTELALSRLLVQNFIAVASPVFSRRLVLDTGGMDERLWYSADWDLWLRLFALCRLRFVARPFVAFRVHKSAQTVTRSVDPNEMALQLETVRQRHAHRLRSGSRLSAEVEEVGKFSNALNVCFMGLAHGNRGGLVRLAASFLAMGPRGWRRYVRDSRILERGRARYAILHRLT